MANNPISMSKLRHILRLYQQGRGKKLIARQTGVARNTLKKYIAHYHDCGIPFEQLDALSDKELEDLFVKELAPSPATPDRLTRLLDLFPRIEKELKKKGTTRQMLWEQSLSDDPEGFCRSQSIWRV